MDGGSRAKGRGGLAGIVAGCIALLAASAFVGGCTAPTLPLPPPAALSVSPIDPVTGLVTVAGEALPGAFVSCINVRLSSGVIVRADAGGLFSLQIEAQAGDALQVWQQIDGQSGPIRDLCVDCLVRDM